MNDLPSAYTKPRSTQIFEEQVTKEKEAVAMAISRGEFRTMGQKRKVAKALGVHLYKVEHVAQLPEIVPRVQHLLRMKALQKTADAMDSMGNLAKTDVAAFKVVAQIAEVLKPAGVTVNTMIDKRNMGDTNSDRRFFERQQERIEAQFNVVESGEVEQ